MTDKEKLVEQYNAFCDAFGIVKPQAIIEACVALDNIVEIAKAEATKWHYPSKGEYPTEKDRQYFCKVKDCQEEWYEVVGWTGKYWILNDDEQVIAWQYFVPPKEET